MSLGNVIVGQSGGPTTVINSSLVGVFKTAKDAGCAKVYGMRNGIEGLLQERVIDMSDYIRSGVDIELLKRTPSPFLGTCRFKLPDYNEDDEIYKKLFAILKKMDIKHFFYIGGNDSMDTIDKLSKYAEQVKSDITFIGIPKTIDNDLVCTDHTPGYGSAAKYIAAAMKEIIYDANIYDLDAITIVEIMGRDAGWLTGATVLSRSEDCEGPDIICLPETVFDYNTFVKKIEEIRKVKKSVTIAVSEGIKLANGKYVCEAGRDDIAEDVFGHKQLGGTALYLSDFLGKEFGIKSRGIVFSTLQRCASHLVSRCDITEAFAAGAHGVKLSLSGETGKMVTFERISNEPYQIKTSCCAASDVANAEKKVPLSWLTNDNTYVTNEFFDYARPLIIGELFPFMVDGVPRHLSIK
ncbi:MAG: 6-phosphofructokinase [Oscillospiraceae bacterium]